MIALVIAGAWIAVGTGVALVIGRGVALADREQELSLAPVSRASNR